MTEKQTDAAKLLRLLIEKCPPQYDHDWHKCPRCLAIEEIQSRAPFTRGLLVSALAALERKERPVT